MPATAMSQEAIHSTLYAALALTDSIFQIWITLTFAVLVATYVAGDTSILGCIGWSPASMRSPPRFS
jgi:hypothetical protein